MEQHRFGPAATGAQNVTEREATTGNQALVVGQRVSTAEQVAHMNINSRKAGTDEGRRHLVLAVYTLFPQDGDTGSVTATINARDVVLRVKSQDDVQPGIVVVEYLVEFFPGGCRIVAQRLNAITHLRPCALHRRTIQLEYDFVVATYREPRFLLDAPDRRRGNSVAIDHHLHLRELALGNLHDGACLFIKQSLEQFDRRPTERQRYTEPTREDHFRGGREKPAVAAIMISEQHVARIELLNRGKKSS